MTKHDKNEPNNEESKGKPGKSNPKVFPLDTFKKILCFVISHSWSDHKYIHRDYANLPHVKYETFWVIRCERCNKRKLTFRGFE
jgi:hypothetical protein